LKILEPLTEKDFELYYDLRWRILRKPWNQPKGSEKDELEDEAIHVMVCNDDKIPVSVGRVHFISDDQAQIRYMAVEENQQGKGIGKLVLSYLEQKAKDKGAESVVLKARDNAVKFYEKNGYNVIKRAHTLYGVIPHFEMKKYI
jgi:ribosomal protein S18 acetylase RimI-like enzyme